jgi:hypothetical protein
VPRSTST